MVVRVAGIRLEEVVIDIADGHSRFHPSQSHGLVFEIDHRAGGILRQGLVDPQTDLGTRLEFALDEMRFKKLFCDGVLHFVSPFADYL